ncbi:tyrosine-protein kinase transmembrane receptor Ror-like isoform X2 [Adelges cooleyi]|uniref:tyrosine-protein kinase transmembrane receptor Ror-like isoform X2 n=2 Tax=Adelges cooleyi TaxID=133065 RepID=UPI00217F9889|nr:tyrosine-protein kinase transmembrane receptor Ror-like isoform X2 [Adelges cooleyi]
MHVQRRKRSAASYGDDAQVGSCVEMKPCGTEAACNQLQNNTYICICPQDGSKPTKDLKCPKRYTVPLSPKTIPNLSINKNEPRKYHSGLTILSPHNTNRSTPSTPLNETTSFFPMKPLYLDVLGFLMTINPIILLAAAVATVTAIVILLVMCWSWTTKRTCCQKKTLNNKTPVVPLIKGMIQDDCYTMNPQYGSQSADDSMLRDTILIPYLSKDCISSMEEIGQGYFGNVYKGTLRHTDGKEETVAIKVLKDHANSEAKEDFMREVEIMTYFRHQNILTLIGVCPQEDKFSPWMVFEYMAYGDLTEVLRNSSEQFTSYSSNLPILDKDALLIISLQIAAGMKYLASQRFVHRDLACRNCLVGNNLTVKIADFGMSRDIYTCDYYKVGGSRLLPVRWMSPESVIYGKFTLESDVWSFGIVLWEIYSLGKQPYYGYSNDEVLKLIHDGVLLEIPLNCPPVICVLMNGCWKSDPKERLRFSDIYERLKNVTKRPELDSPLPRPPALPAIVNHLNLRQYSSEELLDVDNYLQPDDLDDTREYILPLPY